MILKFVCLLFFLAEVKTKFVYYRVIIQYNSPGERITRISLHPFLEVFTEQ